ncbi:MAG: hypothetical protein CMH24_01300 [Nitrosomonadales bacterium]|nr:hypothetical protein [Nitrosomonadales bacterium]|tara:strand:+ start:174 stop:818 length:645 start_codon:yes stop_codon:yes gene_type:complete
MPILPALKFLSPITIFLWPFIVVIYIHFYKQFDEKSNFDLKYIIDLLKAKFKPLLSIGGFCFIYASMVSFVVYAGGGINEDIKNYDELTEKFLPVVIKIILISIPFFMATWFSPLLIAYNKYGFIKAIKSSLAGTLMFSIPLLSSYIVISASFIITIIFITFFFSTLSFLGQNLISFFSSLFLLILLTAYISILFIYQYVTYKDIFGSLKIKSE